MKTTREYQDGTGKKFVAEVEISDEGSKHFERMVLNLSIKARGNKNGRASVADGFIKVSIKEVA